METGIMPTLERSDIDEVVDDDDVFARIQALRMSIHAERDYLDLLERGASSASFDFGCPTPAPEHKYSHKGSERVREKLPEQVDLSKEPAMTRSKEKVVKCCGPKLLCFSQAVAFFILGGACLSLLMALLVAIPVGGALIHTLPLPIKVPLLIAEIFVAFLALRFASIGEFGLLQNLCLIFAMEFLWITSMMSIVFATFDIEGVYMLVANIAAMLVSWKLSKYPLKCCYNEEIDLQERQAKIDAAARNPKEMCKNCCVFLLFLLFMCVLGLLEGMVCVLLE